MKAIVYDNPASFSPEEFRSQFPAIGFGKLLTGKKNSNKKKRKEGEKMAKKRKKVSRRKSTRRTKRVKKSYGTRKRKSVRRVVRRSAKRRSLKRRSSVKMYEVTGKVKVAKKRRSKLIKGKLMNPIKSVKKVIGESKGLVIDASMFLAGFVGYKTLSPMALNMLPASITANREIRTVSNIALGIAVVTAIGMVKKDIAKKVGVGVMASVVDSAMKDYGVYSMLGVGSPSGFIVGTKGQGYMLNARPQGAMVKASGNTAENLSAKLNASK